MTTKEQHLIKEFGAARKQYIAEDAKLKQKYWKIFIDILSKISVERGDKFVNKSNKNTIRK